jgi:hypothetical protein
MAMNSIIEWFGTEYTFPEVVLLKNLNFWSGGLLSLLHLLTLHHRNICTTSRIVLSTTLKMPYPNAHQVTSSLSDMRLKPTTKRKRDACDLGARCSKRVNVGKPTDLDPIVKLNTDVLNIVFEHLEVADIVRCERVSPKWKAFVQGWMERFAVAKKLRPCVPRQMIMNSALRHSYTQIKEFGMSHAPRLLHSWGNMPVRASLLLLFNPGLCVQWTNTVFYC